MVSCTDAPLAGRGGLVVNPVQLAPHPWRLEQSPEPWLQALRADAPPLPLLLLLDRRNPVAAPLLQRLQGWLDPAEQQRLEAFRVPEDRQRFLLARSALRGLLGLWLDRDPAVVSIQLGPHGKPFCPEGPPFNVSHSGDLILLALHPDQPLGVDLECLRATLDWRPIAARVLSAATCQALEALPPPQQPLGFLQAWCRLEARLKARGCGLSGLERLRQERDAVAVGGDAGGAAMEQLWDLRLPAGYQGAVALMPPGADQGAAAGRPEPQ